jgi:hypothetical protein
MNTQQKSMFTLGQILATPGALDALERNNVTAFAYIQKHVSGDWGVVGEEDAIANQEALKQGTRLLSAYLLPDENKIWIFTEAADENGNRVATTLLLPDEY